VEPVLDLGVFQLAKIPIYMEYELAKILGLFVDP
jgi:hypothetical protein